MTMSNNKTMIFIEKTSVKLRVFSAKPCDTCELSAITDPTGNMIKQGIYIGNRNHNVCMLMYRIGHVVRNWKSRFFLLKDDLLYYFRSSDV